MVEADRERFARLMATLAEVYGEASVLKVQAYWMALLRFNWADVEFAALRCLETRRSTDGYPASWPTPADLIGLMWNDQDAVPDVGSGSGRKALPPMRPDPEMQARIANLARQMVENFSMEGAVHPLPKGKSVEQQKAELEEWEKARALEAEKEPPYR